MAVDFRVISIGTLPAHPLWNETRDVRTGHATVTLIRAGDANVLVDPSLPGQVLDARLSERAPITADAVTHVFVTTFTPDHYRGLARYAEATWLLHEPEHDAAGRALEQLLDEARETGDPELVRIASNRCELLERCRPADDRLVAGVDLFPLPGVSPGTCGLLLPLPSATVLVCGDAVPTIEHVEQGKVLPTCGDVAQARESFREAIDIADVLVPGRDNVIQNPVRRML